ncbi:MAG: Uma2 family endonuclease [Spirochaetes bacterium]|nr:MAG: Uma2 family endonuclease [Spirochaetota bacterium]
MAIYKSENGVTNTHSDHLAWPEDVRWEIINRVPYDIVHPKRLHQEVLFYITRVLGEYLEGKNCHGYNAPFEVLFTEYDENTGEEIETVVEPDLIVVCDESKLYERGCRGAPDVVFEILSEETAYKDESVKFHLYEKHGVREYWIVNPDGLYVEVFTLNNEGLYGSPRFYRELGNAESLVLEGFSLDLHKVFKK